MGMNYDRDSHSSRCFECGYLGRGQISRCPQCRQIELMEKSVNGNSSSNSSSSIIIIYILIIGLAVSIVQWIIETIKSFLVWVGEILTAIWNFFTFPFKFTYNFFIVDWSWWKIVLGFIAMWICIGIFSESSKSTTTSKNKKKRKNGAK